MQDHAGNALHQPVRKGRAVSEYAARNGWMIGVVVLCLFLLFAIARTSYNSYQNALFAKAYQYSAPALSQAGAALSTKLKGYENLSMQFFSNRDLNNMLARYVASPDKYDISQFNQAFANFLDGYAFNDSCLYEALFLDEFPDPHKTLTMGEALQSDFIRSFRDTSAFQAILKADGQPVWLAPEPLGTGGASLALGRRIKHLFTGRPLGVLVLLFSEKNLDYFINATQYNDESFTRDKMATDYYLLTGPGGRVLSTPFKNQIGKPVADILSSRAPLGWLSAGKKASGRFIRRVGSDQVLVTYQAVGLGNLYLLNMVTSSSARSINSGSMTEIRDPIPTLFFAGILLMAALMLLMRRPRSVQPAGASSKTHSGNLVPDVSPTTGKAVSPPAWMAELTGREKDILGLLAQGFDNKQIAQQLFMAEQTVKNYVSVIYGKLGVRDRVQASLMAIEAGMTRPAEELRKG